MPSIQTLSVTQIASRQLEKYHYDHFEFCITFQENQVNQSDKFQIFNKTSCTVINLGYILCTRNQLIRHQSIIFFLWLAQHNGITKQFTIQCNCRWWIIISRHWISDQFGVTIWINYSNSWNAHLSCISYSSVFLKKRKQIKKLECKHLLIAIKSKFLYLRYSVEGWEENAQVRKTSDSTINFIWVSKYSWVPLSCVNKFSGFFGSIFNN